MGDEKIMNDISTPTMLLEALSEICPSFRAYWDEPENYFTEDDGSFTFHGLFLWFTHWFEDNFDKMNETTRLDLFRFIESCISHRERDALDEAVFSCFLEHYWEEEWAIKLKKYLGPKTLAWFVEYFNWKP